MPSPTYDVMAWFWSPEFYVSHILGMGFSKILPPCSPARLNELRAPYDYNTFNESRDVYYLIIMKLFEHFANPDI